MGAGCCIYLNIDAAPGTLSESHIWETAMHIMSPQPPLVLWDVSASKCISPNDQARLSNSFQRTTWMESEEEPEEHSCKGGFSHYRAKEERQGTHVRLHMDSPPLSLFFPVWSPKVRSLFGAVVVHTGPAPVGALELKEVNMHSHP